MQRFLCCCCNKTFQRDYLYNANQPGTHEQIVQLTHNGSDVRDIGRFLKISRTTVIAHLKTITPSVTEFPFENEKV
ncbi:MAG: IS1-like element transposase [Endozoicomonas sp. (ex Botrylloides leachii)]|nr:IS1-like element transposase [Endozoicomonas sp. (ex Botrylloides leachii)]